MVAIAGAAAAAIGAGGSILGGLGASKEATKARRSQEEQFRQEMAHQRWLDQNAYNERQPFQQAGQYGIGAMADWARESRDNPQFWDPRQGLDPNQYRWQSLATLNPQQYAFGAPAPVDPNASQFNAQPYQVNAAQYRFDPNQYAYQPGQALDPTQYRMQATQGYNAPTLDPSQFQFKAPTLSEDPGYQFRLQQGVSALDASAAARGGLTSGAAQRALLRYGQDVGSQEYGAAYQRALGENQQRYGRALQQNQDIYGRGFAADQATWQRGLTADEANYQRALQANMTTDERVRAAAAQNYQQQFGANQFNANLGFTAAQQNFARDYQVANDYYNRLVQQQQTGFTQGIAANDLAYQRAMQQNQLAEQRGLGETQRNWQMDLTANQLDQERAWQAYQAEIARKQQVFNQFASLAGMGQTANQLGVQSAGQSSAAMANAFQGLGQAQASGYINQSNAANQMYSGIAGAASQGLQSYMLGSYLQNLGQQGMGFNAAGQQTSGLLPTTFGQYNAGNYANTTYAPFG